MSTFFVEFGKVQGQTSNRNMVKQRAGNRHKISGDEDTAGIASLAPDAKNLRLRIGREFDRV